LPTWMVVEDEPDIYDVLLAMFEIWGIDGIAFVNGEEAVTWIEQAERGNTAGELPELAILDIRLPEMQGPEVAERLRRSPRLGDVAIVMITAYRLSPGAEEQVIKQAQADALMYKPLPAMAELRTKLSTMIAARKAKASAKAKVERKEERPAPEPVKTSGPAKTPAEPVKAQPSPAANKPPTLSLPKASPPPQPPVKSTKSTPAKPAQPAKADEDHAKP